MRYKEHVKRGNNKWKMKNIIIYKSLNYIPFYEKIVLDGFEKDALLEHSKNPDIVSSLYSTNARTTFKYHYPIVHEL